MNQPRKNPFHFTPRVPICLSFKRSAGATPLWFLRVLPIASVAWFQAGFVCRNIRPVMDFQMLRMFAAEKFKICHRKETSAQVERGTIFWDLKQLATAKINFSTKQELHSWNVPRRFFSSVADPDLDVFGPAGSGTVGTRYGSGSFYHQAKIVRKILIPRYCFVTSLWLLS